MRQSQRYTSPVVQLESYEVIEMSYGGTFICQGYGKMCEGSSSRPSSAMRTGKDTPLHTEPTVLRLEKPRGEELPLWSGSSVKPQRPSLLHSDYTRPWPKVQCKDQWHFKREMGAKLRMRSRDLFFSWRHNLPGSGQEILEDFPPTRIRSTMDEWGEARKIVSPQ